MLLQDVFVIDKLTVVNEGKTNSSMKIRGVFQRADEANANKRIYRKSILENSIKSLKPLIEGRMLVGELDHPDANIVRLQNASHVITSLKMVGNEMIGEAEILSTPAGQVVKALISDGVKIGVSSRGMGTISEDKDGVKYVNEDFKLVTFDIVADPSTRGAYPGLAESKKIDMDETIKKAFGEKVLLALLKENLDEGSMGLKRLTRVAQSRRKNEIPEPIGTVKKEKYKVRNSMTRYSSRKEKLSNGKDNLTLENLKHRILDMSVISEGTMGRKRLNRVKNSLEKNSEPNVTASKTNQAKRDYKFQKFVKREKAGLEKLNTFAKIGESDENSQLTIESLKQRILDMSVISEGSMGLKRLARVNSALYKSRDSRDRVPRKAIAANYKKLDYKLSDPDGKFAKHREKQHQLKPQNRQEVQESAEKLRLTIDSLKQEILNRSRIKKD